MTTPEPRSADSPRPRVSQVVQTAETGGLVVIAPIVAYYVGQWDPQMPANVVASVTAAACLLAKQGLSLLYDVRHRRREPS